MKLNLNLDFLPSVWKPFWSFQGGRPLQNYGNYVLGFYFTDVKASVWADMGTTGEE